MIINLNLCKTNKHIHTFKHSYIHTQVMSTSQRKCLNFSLLFSNLLKFIILHLSTLGASLLLSPFSYGDNFDTVLFQVIPRARS